MIDRFPLSICIVDYDSDFVDFLSDYLHSRGCQTTGFKSAEALLESGQLANFDFFLLDLVLPGIDGVDLISLIRARNDAGILVLSGRPGPDSFNSALAAGADMFINKPVRYDQIYHSMASITRRINENSTAHRFWTFDRPNGTLTAPNARHVKLSPLETLIIAQLLIHQGRPLSRMELASATGIAPSPDYRNLDAAVFRLRRKIERETAIPSPVRTIHGVGYQLSEMAAFMGAANNL